jgi:YD repeat-containing protein
MRTNTRYIACMALLLILCSIACKKDTAIETNANNAAPAVAGPRLREKLTLSTFGADTTRFEYDAQNRLVRISNAFKGDNLYRTWQGIRADRVNAVISYGTNSITISETYTPVGGITLNSSYNIITYALNTAGAPEKRIVQGKSHAPTTPFYPFGNTGYYADTTTYTYDNAGYLQQTRTVFYDTLLNYGGFLPDTTKEIQRGITTKTFIVNSNGNLAELQIERRASSTTSNTTIATLTEQQKFFYLQPIPFNGDFGNGIFTGEYNYYEGPYLAGKPYQLIPDSFYVVGNQGNNGFKRSFTVLLTPDSLVRSIESREIFPGQRLRRQYRY